MNVKFMIAVLTYVSVALVHECHAGGSSSKVVPVKDERKTVAVKPNTSDSQQPFAQPPQQSATDDNAPITLPVIKHEAKNEEKAPVTPVPVMPNNEERALVLYKTLEFHDYLIPYPQSAAVVHNKTDTLLLKHAICSIRLLDKEQIETHQIAQEIIESHEIPSDAAELNDFFTMIYKDLEETGQLIADRKESAEEAIQTLKQLVLRLNLAEIVQHTKFQRDENALASRVMITLNEGKGEVVILDVHGLPKQLWKNPDANDE